MIRQILAFIVLCSFSYTAYSQQASVPEKTKYWIFLTDKLDRSGKRTQVEDAYLTDRAVSRRALRGESEHAARFASQDAPISQVYEDDLSEKGFTIEQRSRWMNAVTAYLNEDEVEQISELSYVKEIHGVRHLSPHVEPSTPISPVIAQEVSKACPSPKYGGSCRQLDVVNAIPALDEGITGTGVLLGFVDTHFNQRSGGQPFDHPWMRHIPDSGRLMKIRDFTQRDSSQPCLSWNNHGLNVASVASGYLEGSIIGPGYGTNIYGAVTECSPYERNIEEDNFVAGVEWLESEGVDVITSSLGYDKFDPGQRSYTPDQLDGDTGLTTIAMDWATLRGVVTVTSAGNGGPNPQTIGTPADADSVISVGGVNRNRSVTGFSSRGPTADGRIKPDVSGMASGVVVAGGGPFGANGTSFSAPMIAGIVTQILEVNPNLKPREVWKILTSTSSQAASPDNILGYGIADAYAAIQAARSFATNRSREELPILGKLIIHSPFPNPFSDIVHFTIEAFEPITYAQLTMYDVLGRKAAIVYEGPVSSGGFPIQFDAHHLPPGVYAYTLEFEGRTQSGTVTRLSY